MLAALAVTFAIAIIAAVFAIWPAVTDAPWEDDAPAAADDGNDAIRCEGALSLRASVIAAGQYSSSISGSPRGRVPRIGDDALPGNPGGLRDYDAQLDKADREIDRYC